MCRCLNCIAPPHVLEKMLQHKNEKVREAALRTLLSTAQLRGERRIRSVAGLLPTPSSGRRTISDCQQLTDLSQAVIARTEDGSASADATVNRAFDSFGITRDFYKNILNRDSIDDAGMRLDGFVHFDQTYNNAFWDGQEMIFGDGDGVVFRDLTLSLDVIAHELTHGVTQFTAGLEYHNQSGALNESISDVFGSIVKQWNAGQTADQADWLIGVEVFTPAIDGDALRSMKAPGTAYDNEFMGKDPQPDHMDKYVQLPDTQRGDFGGVHINSGIPNKAFYLTATGIGGNSWDAPGHIWYEALLASNQRTEFQEFADNTYMKAAQLYGNDTANKVADAWRQVGIIVLSSAGVSKGKGPRKERDARLEFAQIVAEVATTSKGKREPTHK